jgi:hypothetical protein
MQHRSGEGSQALANEGVCPGRTASESDRIQEMTPMLMDALQISRPERFAILQAI